MIAEYNQPVHYKNNKGEWLEYNNSFESETSTAENKYAETEYTNKSSVTDIKLSNKAAVPQFRELPVRLACRQCL